MKQLTNQTTFQCEYCNKRFLTKKGARLHEEKYCRLSPIPKVRKEKEILACNHDFQIEYTYITGEAIQEPSCDKCTKCGVERNEFKRMNES